MQAGRDWRGRSWCACMKLPAAHRGGIPISLLFPLLSQKTFTSFTPFCSMFSHWNI